MSFRAVVAAGTGGGTVFPGFVGEAGAEAGAEAEVEAEVGADARAEAPPAKVSNGLSLT